MQQRIPDIDALDERLSEPTPGVIQALTRLPGDIVILGAGGKMGPSLARMARRAADAAGGRRRVIAVSRYSDRTAEARLRSWGVETISCDLLDDAQVQALPEAPLVVYMAGMKFGTTGNEPQTWALNAFLPGVVCRRYRRSRIMAFSSGNIYGMVPLSSGGSRESDAPGPVGEYAWSVLARERVFQHFCASSSIPTLLLRLNYACEMRYGVVVDIARCIAAGQPVSLSIAWLNTIWQRDANAMALQALEHTAVPARILNLTGPETLRVRDVATRLGQLMRAPVTFEGAESDAALLNNAGAALDLFGPPSVGADLLLEMVADWVSRGGESLGKPTHFGSTDGRF